MEKNPVCEMLGIRYPVFQGGMAWIADAELAAAVSNAGGLGLIAAMNSNGEQLREQIKKAKTLTDKTFGVNLMLMSPYIDEAVQVVCEEGIKVVTTGAGNPARYMEQLKAAGYTDSEIERAKKRCGGKRIRNLPAYIKQSIDNERHERAVGQHVSAQDYEQRDYTEVEEQIKRDQAARVEEYKRTHPEEYDENGRLKT